MLIVLVLIVLQAEPTAVVATPTTAIVDTVQPVDCDVALTATDGWTVERVVPDYVGVVCGSAGAIRWGTGNELDYGKTIVLIVDVSKDGETLTACRSRSRSRRGREAFLRPLRLDRPDQGPRVLALPPVPLEERV